MKKRYYPITDKEKLGYLVEECGEVIAAIGKSIRWGFKSFNPELPVAQQETNREWVKRELIDLKLAISLVEERIDKMKVL